MFPLLEGDEYRNFRDDISRFGQLEPIMVVHGDLLLDGRNRLRACLDLKREPKVQEFQETDSSVIVNYVVSKNIKRRHLNEGQQVMIVTRAKKWAISEQNRLR